MVKIVRFPRHGAKRGRPGGKLGPRSPGYNRERMATTTRKDSELGARFWLDGWMVEPRLNRLSRGSVATQVERKAMDVLVYLAERAGEVVDRREIQDAIWQTEFVTYNTVAARIYELREALEDDSKDPRYIQTVPKRGYRLIATVRFGAVVEPGFGVLTEPRHERTDERSPYPGLLPFTESDAENFFGREAEIAALWRKIASRRLLAVVGPSGVGKSSLVRAGVVARAPTGWRAVVCQPGEEPFLALARALAADLAGDAEEMRRLLAFHDPDVALAVAARWRGRWDEALLVVDQFEELFTLNPEPVRERFAELLRRLVDAAGIHVLLVLRDDFLLDCHRHPQLEPIFSDLTPLGPPAGRELRRALTEPAARRLYAFERESMVDEMVGEVEAERGALPLLAFAVSRLWELRDRSRRLLTREAYERIGGVGGALAQHAEATLEPIGEGRQPVVRELFRNLVTAQGTRAVRDRDELLSVFDEGSRAEARSVLRALVDARLLTAFEDEAATGSTQGPHHRVEIVHESLLRAWPQLQRWQAQDAEGALLRDQLRQAAHLWQERGKPDDLLWAATSYREYAVWRERYPGALSELEEAFAAAMTSLATRRRRRRRIAVAAGFAILLAVLGVVGTLWRRSVQETRRAEAAKLAALAQARLVDDPTEALALTTASLEVADTREARELVMRVLWTAPPALELEVEEEAQLGVPSFSPNGHHVAVAGLVPEVRVWSEDGQGPIRLGGHSTSTDGMNTPIWAAGDLLVTGRGLEPGLPGFGDRVRVWSIPEGKLLRVVDFGSPGYWSVGGGRLFAQIRTAEGAGRQTLLRSWRLPDGSEELLDSLSAAEFAGGGPDRLFDVPGAGAFVASYGDVGVLGPSDLVAAPDGSGWVVARGNAVYLHPLGGGGPERLLDELEADASVASFGEAGVLAVDGDGGARQWSFGEGGPSRVWAIRRPAGAARALPDSAGRRVASVGPNQQPLRVWELDGLPGARPLELRRSGSWYDPVIAFHPRGDWCAATTHYQKRLTFWPLARPYPSVIERYEFPPNRRELTFSPDSGWLATGWKLGCVRLVPVRGGDPTAVRELRTPGDGKCADIRFDAEGRYLFVVSMKDAWVVPLDGEPCRLVVPGVESRQIESGAISPSGARVATAFFGGEGARDVYLFDVATGALQSFALPRPDKPTGLPEGINSLEFLDEQTLLTAGWGGVRRWDLATGTHELMVATDGHRMMRLSRAAGIAVTWGWASELGPGLELLDLATGRSRPLEGFGDDVESADLDPSGTVAATGSIDGSIRVGRVDGGEPHLLLGHTGNVFTVAISPDLRWVASAGDDNTVRLWPMPDLSKPPLHTLPHDELLAKLHSLTNLRAVRDPASDTGWKIELGPFPGWRDVPTW